MLKSEHILLLSLLLFAVFTYGTMWCTSAACVCCLYLFSLHSFSSHWPERKCKNLLPSSFFLLLFYFCGCGLCLGVLFYFICLLFIYVVSTYLLLLVQIVRDGGEETPAIFANIPSVLPFPSASMLYTNVYWLFLYHSFVAEYIYKRR